MANHVHFAVEFHQMNDAAKEKLNELYSRIRTDDTYQWFSDMFVDGEELTYEQSGKYEWTLNNIGPKWCYLEDYDEDGFNGEAAWSAPEQGLEKLLEILEEYDPNIISSITYEDEMPNFIGAYVYLGSDCHDGFEDEYDELRDRVIAESETLTEESWNEDEEDWADEDAEDTFREEMWEVISGAQYEIISESVQQLQESLEEIS